jgi:hypothetical protein
MDANTFPLSLVIVAIGLASYVLGRASQNRRIARDFVPIARARGVLEQLIQDYRDIVHQYGQGRVTAERAEIANSMVGILLRLDPAFILKNQWVVEHDPSLVEDFIGRITRGIEKYGSLIEQHEWTSVLDERKPLTLSRMTAAMMQPVPAPAAPPQRYT